jgi:hypothetical protein
MKITIIIVIVSIMILSFSIVHSKSDNEHEKRIEFIKQCLANKDNMVEFIKKSDYYNEDCFENKYNIEFFYSQISRSLDKYIPNKFIFTGFSVRYLKFLNQYLFDYNVQITDKYGIVFFFTENNGESCLRGILNSFIGDLETSEKFLFLTNLIQSVKTSSDSSLIENYFKPDNQIVGSNKIDNLKLHNEDFKIFKETVLNNFNSDIELIHELSGWLNISINPKFYHNLYIRISKNCILNFEYRFNIEKNSWYYVNFGVKDSSP